MTVKIIQRRRTLGQEQVPLTFPEQRGCGRGQPAMTPHQQKTRGDNTGPPSILPCEFIQSDENSFQV